MCFSATASFSAGAVLLGFGTLTLKSARHPREPFLSHVLWPAYVPVAVLLIEPAGRRRRALLGFVAAGVAVGAYLLYVLVAFPVVSRTIGQHVEYVSPHFFAAAVITLYLGSAAVGLLFNVAAFPGVSFVLAGGLAVLGSLLSLGLPHRLVPRVPEGGRVLRSETT